mmetsp:Transcript_19311/g.44402  ORF Transcript_19311/g.44402 Transcript_19311/m.44402 type:complete len:208 (-) Transcript_19311:127-750(-)
MGGGLPPATSRVIAGSRLELLQDHLDAVWKDDYAASRLLRAAHRAERGAALATTAQLQAKGVRVPLPVQSVAEAESDAALTASMPFAAKRRRADAQRGEKRLRLLAGPMFGAQEGGAADERVRALQMRRARAMQVTTTATPPRKAVAAAAPLVTTTRILQADANGNEDETLVGVHSEIPRVGYPGSEPLPGGIAHAAELLVDYSDSE